MDIISLIKEKGSSVARINMLEFKPEVDLNKRAELYEKDGPTLFQLLRSHSLQKQAQPQQFRSLSIQTRNKLRNRLSEGINILKLQKYSHERLAI